MSFGILNMIDSRVFIPMANKTTFWTMESSFSQWHIVEMPTFGTPFTATSGLGVLSDLTTAYDSFVGEHLIEFTPTNIKYVLGEIAFDHSFYVQSLAIYDSELSCHGMSDFMQKITALIGNFDMLPSQFDTSLFPVLATFSTSAVDSLQSCQFLFSSEIETWVGNAIPLIVSEEFSQANVNSNLGFGMLMCDAWNVNLTGEYSEPLVSFIALDSHSLDFAFGYPMQNDWNTANLGYAQFFIGQEFETALRVCDTANPALETRITCFDFNAFFAQFNPIEKIVKRFMQPVPHILQCLRINIICFRNTYLKIFDNGIKIRSACGKKVFAFSKKGIIRFFAKFKLIDNFYLLLSRRIYSILKSSPELHKEVII